MRSRTTEVIVGVVTVVALAILLAITVHLKKSTIFARNKYHIIAYFTNVKRLEVGAPVTIRGVICGDVLKIGSSDHPEYPVKVTLRLTTGTIPIHQGALARVISTGLIGETEVSIEDANLTAPVLKDGDTIFGAPTPDFESIVKGLSDIINNKQSQEAFSALIRNTSSISSKIDEALGTTGPANIRRAIENIAFVTEELREFVTRADSTLTTVGLDLVSARAQLSKTIDDLKTSTGLAMNQIESAFQELAQASRRAEQFFGSADRLLAENRDNAARAIEALTSASEKLARIVQAFPEGRATPAAALIGEEDAKKLSSTVQDLKQSTEMLRPVLEGLNRWLTGYDESRRGMKIFYGHEIISSGTTRPGK